MVSIDMDAMIQEVGLKLAEQHLLWDTRRKRYVEPVEGRVPSYAVAKYALEQLVKQYNNGGSQGKKRVREKRN
jgi:hypothetical protein